MLWTGLRCAAQQAGAASHVCQRACVGPVVPCSPRQEPQLVASIRPSPATASGLSIGMRSVSSRSGPTHANSLGVVGIRMASAAPTRDAAMPIFIETQRALVGMPSRSVSSTRTSGQRGSTRCSSRSESEGGTLATPPLRRSAAPAVSLATRIEGGCTI